MEDLVNKLIAMDVGECAIAGINVSHGKHLGRMLKDVVTYLKPALVSHIMRPCGQHEALQIICGQHEDRKNN